MYSLKKGYLHATMFKFFAYSAFRAGSSLDFFIWALSYGFSSVGYGNNVKNAKRIGSLLKAICIAYWSLSTPLPKYLVQLEIFAYYRIGEERKLRAKESQAWLELDDPDFWTKLQKGER